MTWPPTVSTRTGHCPTPASCAQISAHGPPCLRGRLDEAVKLVERAGRTASKDVEDTLNFAVLHDIRPFTENLPLDRAGEGYKRMMANQARYRVVLTVD